MARFAPLCVALAVCATGCFRSHRLEARDAGIDAARPDSFFVVDAARPDAFTPDVGLPDLGPPPDAGSCMRPEIGTPTHVCVPAATGFIPSDEPYSLPLSFSRCECPETRRCDVALEGDVLSLRTAVCNDPVLCADCEFEVACALPPLPIGHYFVDVNGVRTMEVEAMPRFVPMVARPICAPIPEAPDSSLICDLNLRPSPLRPVSVCRPEFEDVGRYVRVDVVVGCPSCTDVDAGCETQLDGDRVVLHPHFHRCDCPTCGACDPSCTPMTIACVTPALASGVYELVVETADGERAAGPLEIRDVFEPGGRVCTDLP